MITLITKYKPILLLLLVLMIQGNFVQSYGQSPAIQQNELSIATDSTNLKIQPVPIKKIQDFRNSNAFKYDEVQMPGIDFWAIFWYWVNKIIGAIFSNEGPAPYIRYTIMFLVLAFVVYKIVGGGFSGLFSRNKKIKGMNGFEYAEEDIYQQDLDEKLNQSIKNKNYREAIRYYYIKLLKELDINRLIKWEAGKTNRDYKKELKSNPIIDNFVSLSGIYEYSWYGQFEVDEINFQSWQSNFISVIKNLDKK